MSSGFWSKSKYICFCAARSGKQKAPGSRREPMICIFGKISSRIEWRRKLFLFLFFGKDGVVEDLLNVIIIIEHVDEPFNLCRNLGIGDINGI